MSTCIGTCIQGSPHTGQEWSTPTTTQQFLPPLTKGKNAEMLCLMQFDSTLAKV